MAAGKRRRWVWIVAAVLALLVAGGIASFRIAVAMLKERVVESLGPEGEIAEIRMGWSSLDIVGVRIAAPEGWPASDDDAIPGSRLEIFGEVGHYPHCETPARFVAVLVEFITSTEPARLPPRSPRPGGIEAARARC